MGKRLALMGIIVENNESASNINSILHEYAECVVARMGVPYREREVFIISVVLDAEQDKISALGGKIGRLKGVRVNTSYSSTKTNA